MEDKKIKITELDPSKFYIISIPDNSFDNQDRFRFSDYLKNHGINNFVIVPNEVEVKEKEDTTLDVEESWYALQNS